jgi:L-rhamnonate dehydratase
MMKIAKIETMRMNMPRKQATTPARRESWTADAEVANPMSKFPEFKRRRSLWQPKWESVWVKVTAEDGTYGLGTCSFGRPVVPIIEDHYAKHLVG